MRNVITDHECKEPKLAKAALISDMWRCKQCGKLWKNSWAKEAHRGGPLSEVYYTHTERWVPAGWWLRLMYRRQK